MYTCSGETQVLLFVRYVYISSTVSISDFSNGDLHRAFYIHCMKVAVCVDTDF